MSQFMSQIYLKVGGTNVKPEMMDAIDSIEVDQSLLLPDMFSIRLRDSAQQWLNDDTFDFGKTVDIEVGPKEETETVKKGKLFTGEITAIEPEFDRHGATILVRGYDKSHRLHRGKKTRTFLKKKDSDLVNTIAGECGLSADVDSTTYKHEYILQDNQTNMEFLQDRARRVGYFVYVNDGKLCFKKPASVGTSGPDLELGVDLLDFKVRMTTAEQADKGIARGWDQKNKQAVVGNVTPSTWLNWGGMTQTGGDKAKSAFESAEAVVANRPLNNVDEAKAMAQSALDEQSSAFVQAEGTCNGNPQVFAGVMVNIKAVGNRFSGKYLVSRAVHRFDLNGYFTRFEINGRRANTLGQLLAGNGSSGRSMVEGMVTNLNDPDNLGRLKVKYPSLPMDPYGSEIESDWARLVTPMAGAERGILFLPEVNDEVLVIFENGDIHRPYILGGLWSTKDKPPQPTNQVVSGGVVNQRVIKSRSGHTITLDDTDGNEKISIIDKTGKNSFEIDSKENTLTINCEKDITIEGKGNLTLKGKTILIEATQGGNMDLKANNVNLNAQASATVKGGTGVDIKAAQVNIKGDAATKVEGLTVSINGTTMTEVKGTIVKIN